ncbi:MAG: hypothetical protein J6Y60_03480 [Treponema sp.]|nr:hypothetical protein [Treponema sp.]
MENLSLVQLKDFGIVALAVMAFVVLIGNVIKTVAGWKKPHDDLEKWRRDVDTKLTNDNGRLDVLEGGNRVICRGILAMLSHEINGNSNDKLLASQKEITDYLIDK